MKRLPSIRLQGHVVALGRASAFVSALLCACSGSGSPSTDGGGADRNDDGNGTAPVQARFNGKTVAFPQCEIFFDSTTGETRLAAQYTGATAADDQSFTLFFPGQGTGTFSCGAVEAGAVTTGFTYNVTDGSYSSTSSASLTPCQIIIDRYEAVGGTIAGTFSGVVFANSTLGGAPQQVDIQLGTYSVLRLPDQ